MKFIKTLPLLMVAGLSLVGCNKVNDVDAIKKAGFLNVGITIYEPMDYYDDDGETIIGFDAELSEAFAKSLDVSVRFIPIKWDSKILELTSNKIDVIWNGMTITDELKANSIDNKNEILAKVDEIENILNSDETISSINSIKEELQNVEYTEGSLETLVDMFKFEDKNIPKFIMKNAERIKTNLDRLKDKNKELYIKVFLNNHILLK